MFAIVLVALAQAPTSPSTLNETDGGVMNASAGADNYLESERTMNALERTAAAAERTAAAAEKIAQMQSGQKPADTAAATADEQGWTGTAGIGLVSLTGNSESLTLTGLVNLERKTENWIVRAKANGAYGQARAAADTTTDADVVALRALGELRGDRRFGERATGFVMAGADTDHVKSVEERLYGEAGASMVWLDSKAEDFQRLLLRTDLALRYVDEIRFQYYPTPLDVADVSLFGPRFGVAFRYGLSKETSFTEDAEVIPDITSGTGRVLFNSTSKISSKLTSSFALSIGFTVTHDSVPAPGKRTTDTALIAGVDFSLMIKEFREFLLKQNALALAIGVVIGAAIGKVVSGVVDDLIMPLVGVILPGGDWRALELGLGGGNAIKYGDLLGRLVDFVIIALVVFAITKALLKPAPPANNTKICAECLEVVPLAAKRCRACTSALPA